ncbi:MAG: hypothetical protein JSU85_07255 [Candidatus Zixiibacteriota bacterium]|nr:MAG: hypothetical protein JSU85_07255 [candidate division Zixibacteria bacterium]
MNYNILILAVAFFNFMVGAALLYFLVGNFRAVRKTSSEKHRNLDRYFDDLLERIQRLEKNYPVQAVANLESYIPGMNGSGVNRIKSVVEILRNGGNPDEVRREYGYSGSEMGLILAAAGLTGKGSNAI